MSLQRNHYEVLGLPHGATVDQIKKKYRELARKFHPDVVQDKVLGQKVFSQINQAYRILVDPERRTQYDSSLEAEINSRIIAGVRTTNPPRANGAAASQPPDAQQMANVPKFLSDADAAVMQGQMGQARILCEKVLTIDPRNLKALGILGDALAQMGRPTEAAAAYRRALQIQPSPLLQAKLSRLGVSTGAPSAASPSSAAPRPSAPPPSGGSNGSVKPSSAPTPEATKPSGGLFGRLLGRK